MPGDVERELKQYGSIPRNAFIMIHTGTGWYSNTQEYFNSPFITPAAAERIIRLRPVAVGVNGPTVDDRRGEGRPSTAPSCPMMCISSKASCVPNFWQENDSTVRPCP